MPVISGPDFLKSLKHSPEVILTTAVHNYALEGYDLDVIDCLLKPVTFQRFLKAIEKYNNLGIARKEAAHSSDFIYLKSNKKHIKLYTVEQFLRIHRSYIVNVTNITAFTASDVEINNKELPIGNSYKELC